MNQIIVGILCIAFIIVYIIIDIRNEKRLFEEYKKLPKKDKIRVYNARFGHRR